MNKLARSRTVVALLIALAVLSTATTVGGSSAAAPAPEAPAVIKGPQVILRLDQTNRPSWVPPATRPAQLGAQNATFTVNFEPTDPDYNCGTWPQEAKAAFNYAIEIWEPLIDASQPIAVDACWTPLGASTLGMSGPYLAANFTNAPDADTWYPMALANELAGTNLASGPEIFSYYSSDRSNWYFGTAGNPGVGKIDFVTVVLHEIGHGLGIIGSMNVSGGQGSWGDSQYGFPAVFDLLIENGARQSLLGFTSPSPQLATQLQSDDVWLNGTNANAANGGARPRLYAPNPWEPGSSIYHLDEDAFPAGNDNALLTPYLAQAEANHNPGQIVLGLLQDLGWHTSGSNTAPTISGLPDQMMPANGSADDVIDLWAYTEDAESADSELTFTIDNAPDPNAGVSIDGNRYIDIHPASDWAGQTDVVIRVTDPVGLYDTDTFRVTVTDDGSTTYLPLVLCSRDTTPGTDDFAAQVVERTNLYRALAGCPALNQDTRLTSAAEGHSEDMALNDFFSHTSSDGSSPWDRIRAADYQFSLAAENIAAGYTTPEAVVDAWMDCSDHRDNILDCDLLDIGVGYYYLANDAGSVSYQHYWTQILATP